MELVMSSLYQEFKQNGFVVLRNFFSKEEISQLLDEIKKTGKLFLGVGDENTKKMFFYHNLYRKSVYLRGFCSQPRIVDIFSKIIGPSFWIRWDHAVLKKSEGEQYPWHQDNAYSKVKDASFQLWVALTDADEKTGGLFFQKGSHRKGHLPHRHFSGRHIICDEKAGEEVKVFAKAGDVIIFSSLTLHRSEPNRSDAERWVYIVEYMSKKHYDPTIQPPYFMIAESGRAKPEFVSWYPGNLSPINQLKYYRYNKGVQAVRHSLKEAWLYASGKKR